MKGIKRSLLFLKDLRYMMYDYDYDDDQNPRNYIVLCISHFHIADVSMCDWCNTSHLWNAEWSWC